MQRKQTHLTYALITALAMILINVALILTHHVGSKLVGSVIYIPFLIGLILNGQAFSKANNANVTFGQDFLSCFKATMIITLVYTIWTVASVYLFPQFKLDAMEAAQKQIAESGRASSEATDMAMSIMERGFVWILALGSLFGVLFVGTIFSLIAAAVAKKNPMPTQPTQMM